MRFGHGLRLPGVRWKCKLPAVIPALAEKAAEHTLGWSPASVCSMIDLIWKTRTGLSCKEKHA